MLLIFFFFVFFIFVLSGSSLLLLSLTKPVWRKRSPNLLPPSPPRLPLIGNLHLLGSLPHRSLQALAKKYGPLMLFHLGTVPTLVVSSAELAQEIMKTHDLAFASRPSSRVAKRLSYNCKDVAFSPYGEYWRQARRIFVLHLLSTKRVQSFRAVREEEVDSMIRKIGACSCTYSSARPINLSDFLITLTNDITCRVAFGKKYSGADHNMGGDIIRKLMSEFLELLGAFDVGDLIPSLAWLNKMTGLDTRVEKIFHELDTIYERIIEEHVLARKSSDGYSNQESHDLADVLLGLEKDSTFGISLDRDSIKAIIMDVFAAGTDTTFTVMEWIMAELIRHPQVMNKVQEEVRETAGGKSMVVEEDIEQMYYLKCVIKETLRIHAPVALLLPHESIEAVQLRGYDIPSKMRVIINAWAIGRDPETWESAEEFWPERFVNSSVDFKGQDFQFIPFGAGRRGCPGIHFAIQTIELALANLLYHFKWEVEDGKKGEELDVSEQFGLTTHKKSSLMLVVRKCFT